MRMANLMFVRCGNTNYFPMMAHFILYMCCCSEAEFELTCKRVFTKSSRYGCRMFSDLFVEMVIKYIRAVGLFFFCARAIFLACVFCREHAFERNMC